MELTLTRQVGTQVAVTCDGQPSHTFDLPPLPDEKKLLGIIPHKIRVPDNWKSIYMFFFCLDQYSIKYV